MVLCCSLLNLLFFFSNILTLLSHKLESPHKRFRISCSKVKNIFVVFYLPFCIVAVGTGPPLAPIRKSSGSDSYGGSSYQC